MATETEKKETHICVICREPFTGYGNNPHPVKFTGRCCVAATTSMSFQRE